MKKEQAVFLISGLAFGFLLGYAVFNAIDGQPALDAAAAGGEVGGPRGPAAPTQTGGTATGGGGGNGGAPMVAEINALKRQLPADPSDDSVEHRQALVRLANLYQDVQMWAQAVEFYERAVGVDPDNPDLLTDLGTCYRNRGEPQRALELFARANELKGDHWQSLFNSAIVLTFDLGEFDRARGMIDRLAALPSPPPQLADLRSAVDQAEAQAAGGAGS